MIELQDVDGMTAPDADTDYRPLADRMRPLCVDQFFGQSHLLAPGKPLRRAIDDGALHSMVFWGPPGTGKTTLARLISGAGHAHFIGLSAVLAGVKDIRAAVGEATAIRAGDGRRTVLFLDEVHRFNKAQQDAFLPFVEDGTLVFIGATTENPSFELNKALLSRARVYVLKRLTDDELIAVLRAAIADADRGLGRRELRLSESQLRRLAQAADGDARRALGLLELASDLAAGDGGAAVVPDAILADVISGGVRRFDKQGEDFYDQISALHKSVRGSNPDAALYWFARMLDGGCDPGYLARRIVRMASEDVGNADPRAVALTLDAWDAYERLGSPEGDLALAQAVIYLACAPKSNAVYRALQAAQRDVSERGSLEVPLHLRNAPANLMKKLGYGRGYRYAHDEADGFAAGADYFPDDMKPATYYHPVPRGLEQRIAEKLERLRQRDAEARARPERHGGSDRGG
jgi:putative ATPase